MLKHEHVCAGCAFLKYETKEQAIAAIEALNGVHKMEVTSYSFIHKSYLVCDILRLCE